jgi:two-component system, chemotaxis family, protein-glutamate methylesterase/glutaminase
MRGGLSVAQDPGDAFAAEMPSRAIQYAGADFIVPVAKIPSLLAKLAREPLPAEISREGVPVSDRLESESRQSDLEDALPKENLGKPSSFACSECHGVGGKQKKNFCASAAG